ncbi:MAG: VOC family protein [Thermoanaerobaculia bacterium]
MIKRIGTASVYVTNQDKAIEFWTKKVGFEVRRDTPMAPDARWIEVGPAGAESCLVLYPRAIMPGWEQMKPSIVFISDNALKDYETLKANGVRVEEPQKLPFGTFVKFADNDGNEFVLKG